MVYIFFGKGMYLRIEEKETSLHQSKVLFKSEVIIFDYKFKWVYKVKDLLHLSVHHYQHLAHIKTWFN